MKAVGRHARSGGNKVRGSGGVMMVDMVNECELWIVEVREEDFRRKLGRRRL